MFMSLPFAVASSFNHSTRSPQHSISCSLAHSFALLFIVSFAFINSFHFVIHIYSLFSKSFSFHKNVYIYRSTCHLPLTMSFTWALAFLDHLVHLEDHVLIEAQDKHATDRIQSSLTQYDIFVRCFCC